MDVFELEKTRIYLVQNLGHWTSTRQQFFAIYNYFDKIISTNNKSLLASFIPEFIEEYAQLLAKIDPFYFHPRISAKIIEQSRIIVQIDFLEDIPDIIKTLTHSINIFTEKYEHLINELNGKGNLIPNNKIKFPIVDNAQFEELSLPGFLENITVSIKKSAVKNVFILIPSGNSLEKKIENQLQVSWQIATDYLKKYKNRLSHFHEVIISFDKKYGFCSGDSLGMALTISFIEQLLQLYNTDYLVSIKPGVVITGGISVDKNIIDVSKEIVEKKTEIAFYSTENIFVLPKNDEAAAKAKYLELQEEFPKRKLEIVGVENLDDLLNRRNIVEITKQNIVKKTAKRLSNNWQTVFLICVLSIIVGFYVFRDFDNNPSILESSENTLYVKNKVGKVLWTSQMGYHQDKIYSLSYLNYFQKFVDINDDGINEVILSNEAFSEFEEISARQRIVCFDKDKKELWSYTFRDRISSGFGEMDTSYNSFLIDTLTFDNKKSLLCISTSTKSFSSAIYMLDLKTGKRLQKTLWNSGFFTNGLIKDFDNDGKNELVATFCNNGFEQIGLLTIGLEHIDGQCPTTQKYSYYGLPLANLKTYMLFPKTDYSRYINMRIEGSYIGSLLEINQQGKLYIPITLEPEKASLMYVFDHNKNKFEIIIGNEFRVIRDSLVVQGKLKLPLTDTDEYCNLLISQIKYWNGKEFVYRKDLD